MRRYNFDQEDGDDRGVELGGIVLTISENERFLEAIVLGTSWGGDTKDDYITHKWGGAAGTLQWARRYDNGGNDVARGLVVPNAWVYVTGYSEAGSDIDFATLSYDAGTGSDRWDHRWNYVGDPDYPADIEVSLPAGGGARVWVTGAAHDGSFVDIATLRYFDSGSGVTLEWSDTWSSGTTAGSTRAG